MKLMDSDTIVCVDRISQLPDSLLYEILSYLPTKNVVATCILSTRWNKLIPFAVSPNKLFLDDSQLLHPENDSVSTTFMHFVDKLLNEMLINEFCVPYVTIRCQKQYGDAKFLSWVCAALHMNVEHLLLKYSLTESEYLFGNLNGCKTLTRLELGGVCSLSFPNEFRLPNLKSLRLCGVIFGVDDQEVLEKLMIWCPLLRDLRLSSCDFRDLILLCIHSLSLKNLFMENCWDEFPCDFTLYAPSLEVLMLKNCLGSGFCLSTLSCLNCAMIDIGQFKLMEYNDEGEEVGSMEVDEDWYYHWAKLVTVCFTASRLYLNHWAIEALHKLSHDQFPMYHNLTSLSLGCIRETNGWEVLARLLCSAPNLDTLELREGFKKCRDGYTTFESLVSTTPVCLELHLKRIDIKISGEEEDEIKLIEYFLNNGKVTEKIRINCFATSNRDGLDRLQGLPEGSKIHFLVDGDAGLFDLQVSSFIWYPNVC